MDFEHGPGAREAERRVADLLAAEAGAIAALPGLGPDGLRRLLLAAQGALAGDAGREVAGRLAVARVSAPLLLALEASRHLRDLILALAPRALPPDEGEALRRGERIGAVAHADAAGAEPARLRRSGGAWRLSADKPFVTNGPLADLVAVFADADGGEAICLVFRGDEGVQLAPRADLMGLDGLAVSALVAEDAPLPEARVLGPFAHRAASERYRREADLSIAVAAAGLMRGALASANRAAHARGRGGRPAFTRQEVAFQLAEVLALAEAAELLCHRAAWLADSGDPEAGAVALCAKVFCTESAERAAAACLRVAGGEGYRRGSVAERAVRDAAGLALAGTTIEVARMAVADALLSRA